MLQVRWKSLWRVHRQFSYKSLGERILKISPHLPKLLSNINGLLFFWDTVLKRTAFIIIIIIMTPLQRHLYNGLAHSVIIPFSREWTGEPMLAQVWTYLHGQRAGLRLSWLAACQAIDEPMLARDRQRDRQGNMMPPHSLRGHRKSLWSLNVLRFSVLYDAGGCVLFATPEFRDWNE